ncbi:MAG TPA: SPOR domain-containing protein [Woeseiaceae bacterium]|jgi:hypothetical protein|nr:SPOR domain-containing protein [Woeseiaceae bacterium]
MRNLLLLLLLANILYFIWETTTEEPPEEGVEIIDASGIGPPLPLVNNHRQAALASVGEAAESGSLLVNLSSACVSIGPFANSAEAERVLADYRNEGMRGKVRSTQGQLFVGHWVQITDVPSRDVGNEMLKRLVAAGLNDAYLISTEEEGLKISLGLFDDRERAERVELQAESLDLPAVITPRTRDAIVFFVDLGLLPGRGASAMIERFGEDKVLLREKATCPPG